MSHTITPNIVVAIGAQATKVQHLALRATPLELDRLRDETAALQALIAEAASLDRRGILAKAAADTPVARAPSTQAHETV